MSDYGFELRESAWSLEYADGYFGMQPTPTYDQAKEAAYQYALENPSARVWINGEQLQEGFRAADDVSGMW
jgi:hypothetical protein